MAISFDAAASSTYEASLSTYSWTHTVASQSDRVLIVAVSIFLTGTVTSITYNGVSLTQDATATITSGIYRSEIWYLIAPDTGSHSVTVTLDASVTSIANAATYYGVDQTTPIEATATASRTGLSTSAVIGITTIADNSWIVGNLTTAAASVTSDGAQNSRLANSGALGTSAMDDKGPISPAAATSLSWSGVGTSSAWLGSIVSLLAVADTARRRAFTAIM